jgi:hypothetical protein
MFFSQDPTGFRSKNTPHEDRSSTCTYNSHLEEVEQRGKLGFALQTVVGRLFGNLKGTVPQQYRDLSD